MHDRARSITWHDEAFLFQGVALSAAGGSTPSGQTIDSIQWAVYRSGEFIGMMACPAEVSTKEFDVRCLRWLRDLLAP